MNLDAGIIVACRELKALLEEHAACTAEHAPTACTAMHVQA
jgi:hypothetical protein